MRECIDGFRDLCDSLDEYFESSEDIITLKRNQIKIIKYKNDKFVIKKFKRPNFINRIVYRYFRDSKAKRSYENGEKLLKLDIFNPQPIGYIEKFDPLFSDSYYISRYFDFDFEIRAVLADEEFEDREKILKDFIAYSYNLHQKGIYHIDYSPGNVLIKKDKNVYKFALVDLNRMKFIKFDNELRFKNLSRFSANEQDTIFLAKEYAKISNIDEDMAVKLLQKYHDKHQKYRENKRKLKTLKATKTSNN